jgi:hypothetical protein
MARVATSAEAAPSSPTADHLVLVRTHGTYTLYDAESSDVPEAASLNGNSYLVREPRIVPLAELPAATKEVMAGLGSPGLFVSSVEVIDHLRKGGIELPKPVRGAPRAAIVTTVMVKSKPNPLPMSHEHFFVGVAEGPRCGAAAERKAPAQDATTTSADRKVGTKVGRQHTATIRSPSAPPQPAPSGS